MENETNPAPQRGGLAARVFRWVDARTGARSMIKRLLDEPIPGGARLAYIFGSGLLFIFLLQAITGVSLSLYYTPTAETAHTSVAYISKQVAGGAFLRSLHSYGSSAMIVVLVLHFLQTFLYGSFKGRRELLWLSGALLSLLVLCMGFTGYLLPWDQKAYFATAVGTNVAGQMPLIGDFVTRLLRGGDTIGTLTLSRFYVAHVFLIPATIFLFIGAHVFLFRKAGPAGPVNEDPLTPRLSTEPFYPRQVFFDMGFALLVMAVLSAMSYLRPVTLGPIANPADTHFLPRPEWYYLPMFEWLKFWEGRGVVVGVVIVPGLLATAFFLMPFLDRRLERQPWRRPIPALAVAIVVLGMVYLGIRSQMEDRQGAVAAQLALQEEQESAYSAAPFEPYHEPADGMADVAVVSDPGNPRVARGKGIFTERGCVGCHGSSGTGTAAAPSLVGVTRKFPEDQLVALLHNPNARMKAGRMPTVDASDSDMSALVAYLGALGTGAANVPAVYPAVPQASPRDERRSIAMESGHGSRIIPASYSMGRLAPAGQLIFQERACFACHGPAGTGGRAPALAPLAAKLGNAELTQLLEDPNSKMRAGGMPPVIATPEQVSALVAYLRSLPMPHPRTEPTQEVPARRAATESTPIREAASPAPVSIAYTPSQSKRAGRDGGAAPDDGVAGREFFVSQGCVACHGIHAQGTRLAPSLIGVASKFPGDKLSALLRHPTSKMQGGGMPVINLDDSQLHQLVGYLSSLKSDPVAQPEGENPVTAQTPATSTPTATDKMREPQQTLEVKDVKKVELDPLVLRGRLVFDRNACGTCHGAGGMLGTVAAPGLAGTASLLPAAALENLLRHHSARMQKGGMPPTNFNTIEMKAIVAFIRSLQPLSADQSPRSSGPGNGAR